MNNKLMIPDKNEIDDLIESQVKRAFDRINKAHIKKPISYNITICYKSKDDGLHITACYESLNRVRAIKVDKVIPWHEIIRHEHDPIPENRYAALCDLIALVEEIS